MEQKRNTDWELYYSKPKSKISSLTQKFTLAYLERCFNQYVKGVDISVMECGGGNSCFAEDLQKLLPIKNYDIIDNCEIAVSQAGEKAAIRRAYSYNLVEEINDSSIIGKYDVVYSVGLIEHFSEADRIKVIENHFKLCNAGGYVVITAPTPTVKYRFIRKCMELLHVWQFFDEVPLTIKQVAEETGQYGKVVFSGINKKLPLSQLVIVCEKQSGSQDQG